MEESILVIEDKLLILVLFINNKVGTKENLYGSTASYVKNTTRAMQYEYYYYIYNLISILLFGF